MDSPQPKISIIVPTYNQEKTLKRAVRSALRQTVGKEIIIIDDCSNGKSKRIIKNLMERNPEIRLIENGKNLGSGISRNKGIEEAKGEFVSFLDSDDIYPNPVSLEKTYGFAKQRNLDICRSLRENRFGFRNVGLEDFRKECESDPDGTVLKYEDYQQDYDYTSYIFRRSFLLDNRLTFPPYRRYQDVPFFVNCMIEAGIFGVVPVCGYRYTIRLRNPLKYDNETAEDLLKGLTDVLVTASENNLPKLLTRTVKRINREYREVFVNNYNEGNANIAVLLEKANASIDRKLEGCESLRVFTLPERSERMTVNEKNS